MTTLVLGANTALPSPSPHISIESPLAFGQTVGMVWLALGDDQSAKISPAYLHEPKDWANYDPKDNKWRLDLPKVFAQGVVKLQLVIYAYHDLALALPATEIANISLNIEGIGYQVPIHERHIKTAIVLEIYERGGQYKCRALAECTPTNLKSFGEHLGIALYEKFPQTMDANTPRRPMTGETWTGTAFAIDSHHLLTCHHVIDGASVIGIRQQGRADRQAFLVMSDEGSDTAIIRVDEPLPSVLSLAMGQTELLGESIVAMGFPLSGLTSQLQVTSGNISGLLGVGDDIRFLQFTAPIQAGSSGSPLLLPDGQVIGMVMSSITNAQNMNYAVKYQLLSAILTSAGVANASRTHTPMSTPQLVKEHKDALWLVGCQA